jgi:hypothetical protein
MPRNKNKRRLAICSQHGHVEGYLVCRHLLSGEQKPAWVEHPGKSHETMGQALCSLCVAPDLSGFRRDLDPHALLVLTCGFCCRDRRLNKIAVEPTLSLGSLGVLDVQQT